MKDSVNHFWDNFWKGVILDEDGGIDEEQLKRELSDYSLMMIEVSKVYDEVTGGVVRDPTTSAVDVIRIHGLLMEQVIKTRIEEACEVVN